MTNKMDTTTDIVGKLRWRYATKKFDSQKKISDELWQQLEEALVLTPSSYGLSPWKFVVVTDQKVKEELANASFQQPQPRDCSHLVVISRRSKIDKTYVGNYVQLIADTRQVPVDSLDAYSGMMTGFIERSSQSELEEWMAKQCYIALGNLMTTAALLHVDACPMEGFNKSAYDKIIGLADHGLNSVVLCALGYRDQEDKYANQKKVRHAASDVVLHI